MAFHGPHTLETRQRIQEQTTKWWARRAEIPRDTHHLVTEFFELMRASGRSTNDVGMDSKVAPNAITCWRRKGRVPSLINMDSALNALGYRLAIEKIEDD